MNPTTLATIEAELARARAKFPPSPKQSQALFAALAEELGEVAKAILEDGKNSAEVYKEASHVACVAIRIMEEGL